MAERRILMKLSGELLCSPGGSGVESERAVEFSQRLARGLEGSGTQLALVVGGGNFLRGAQARGPGIDRITADQMGMLATVLNALALRSALEHSGLEARVLSAFQIGGMTEPFVQRRAIRHLECGRIVIFAGGTGHPFFTTDTTASLRALEIGASILAKGTKVRGVFSADPVEHPSAEFIPAISYEDVLRRDLRIMDLAAISLCKANRLPILVFDMRAPQNIEKVLAGERIGSIVS